VISVHMQTISNSKPGADSKKIFLDCFGRVEWTTKHGRASGDCSNRGFETVQSLTAGHLISSQNLDRQIFLARKWVACENGRA
jgi:hypothetical protein